MGNTYMNLTLMAVNRNEEDTLSLLLFEFGALGITENLDWIQPPGDYRVTSLQKDDFALTAYFEMSPPEELFAALATNYGKIKWECTEQPDKDWMEEWKKGFEAFSLVDSIWVVPSWLEAPKDARQIIKIDPGMAFGTGTHETTQLAAKLLKSLADENKVEPGFTLMDVGTGSGILCVLAKILKAGTVRGNDIDSVACEVAQINLEINKCDDVTIDTKSLTRIDQTFDVVVANIIDGVLIDLRLALMASVRPNGYLILTGILLERDDQFRRRFFEQDNFPFRLVKRVQKADWIGYLVQHVGSI